MYMLIPPSPVLLENPRDGEPGGLPFMGSHRVGHEWSDLAYANPNIPIYPFSLLFPGNHKFVFYICDSTSVL